MTFQDNLKKYREMAGYTQAKEFAEKIGVPYQTYMGYENRGREPKFDTLKKIANALHVSIDELLGYMPEPATIAHLEATGFSVEKKSNGKIEVINKKGAGLIIEVDSYADLTKIVKNSLQNVLIEKFYKALTNELIYNEMLTYYAERNGWPIIKYPQEK